MIFASNDRTANVFTSSYSQFKGSGRVGISRGMPRGIPAGFRRYAPLAPGEWLYTTEDQSEYRERYFAQLAKLDPARVVADLHRLAGSCAVPTLLCFCNLLETGAWCHRTMVAEWITDKTGLATVELSLGHVRKIRAAEQLNLSV